MSTIHLFSCWKRSRALDIHTLTNRAFLLPIAGQCLLHLIISHLAVELKLFAQTIAISRNQSKRPLYLP
jgi:hypothetical protein